MPDARESLPLPRLDRLSEDGVERIHDASLTILAEMGIRVDHEEVRRLLAENGCTVDDETGMVTFPRSFVEDCVARTPSSFTIRGRGSGTDVEVGDGNRAFVPCAGAPNIIRYDEGRRQSTVSDYEDLLKLAHAEDLMDTTGFLLCEMNDVPQGVTHLEMTLRHLLFSDKPVKGWAYGADRARDYLEMVGIAYDDPDLTEPYLIGGSNSVSPRIWDAKQTAGIAEYARHDQPVLVAPAAMAAASGPATLAGTMALSNAENLAGIAIVQTVNPGNPVVYSMSSSNVDVRYGSFAIGSPEGALFTAFAGQMARFYDLPARAGGGLTDAKAIGDQSGTESTLQTLTAMSCGIDLFVHSAGIMDSYGSCSLEKFVLDCERIRHLQRFERGYAIDEESLALDLVAEVEPGDHFLNQRHTLEHSKEEFFFPDLYARDSYDNWVEDGRKSAVDRAHERVETLLDEYERPPVDGDVERDLRAYTEERRAAILD